jgi:hypothetical protein
MAIKFKHKTQSTKPSSADPSIISSDQWNEDHEITTINESEGLTFSSTGGHDHDGANSTKAAKAVLADKATLIKDDESISYVKASTYPVANEVVILDSNGNYCQGSTDTIVRKIGSTLTEFGKKVSSQISNFVSAGNNNFCRNCYFDGANWMSIATGVAERIELDGVTPKYFSKSVTGNNIISWDAAQNINLQAPLSTQSLVTGTRALGGTYQNTGTTPMFVTISTRSNFSNVNCSVNYYACPSADLASILSFSIGETGGFEANGNPSSVFSFSFFVLPGYYYKTVSSGNNSLVKWTEWS